MLCIIFICFSLLSRAKRGKNFAVKALRLFARIKNFTRRIDGFTAVYVFQSVLVGAELFCKRAVSIPHRRRINGKAGTDFYYSACKRFAVHGRDKKFFYILSALPAFDPEKSAFFRNKRKHLIYYTH